jgi:ribosome-associated toxin RatA of RatAB toxin-antitoxin module
MLAIVAIKLIDAKLVMMWVKRKTIVPYTPQQMYCLVNDIRSYPKFISWCTAVDILSESDDEICARLHVEKGPLKKSFTTKNLLQPGRMMEIKLVDGPFKYLHGFWSFSPYPENKCKVEFDLQFEFKTPMLSGLFNPIFNSLASGLVDCFVQRAKEVYG